MHVKINGTCAPARPVTETVRRTLPPCSGNVQCPAKCVEIVSLVKNQCQTTYMEL